MRQPCPGSDAPQQRHATNPWQQNRKYSDVDIVIVNGQSVALIEDKYKAHLSDLNQFEAPVLHKRTGDVLEVDTLGMKAF